MPPEGSSRSRSARNRKKLEKQIDICENLLTELYTQKGHLEGEYQRLIDIAARDEQIPLANVNGAMVDKAGTFADSETHIKPADEAEQSPMEILTRLANIAGTSFATTFVPAASTVSSTTRLATQPELNNVNSDLPQVKREVEEVFAKVDEGEILNEEEFDNQMQKLFF